MGFRSAHSERGNLRGKAAGSKVYGRSAVNCMKTAEPIEVPFGSRTRVGSRNHVLAVGCDLVGTANFRWEKGRPVVKYSDSLS